MLTPVTIKNKVDLVKWVFDFYMQGLGSTKIAEELNKRKEFVPKGKAWSYATIINLILRNIQVLGLNQYNKRSNKTNKITPVGKPVAIYPKIIPLNTFEKVQRLLDESKIGKGSRTTDESYIFSNKLVSGYTGLTMVIKKLKKVDL